MPHEVAGGGRDTPLTGARPPLPSVTGWPRIRSSAPPPTGRRPLGLNPALLFGFVWLVASTFVALVALGARALDRPFSYFSREPAKVLGGAWYAGFLSNMGALLWAVAATACLLAWWAGRRRLASRSNLLLWAGLLTTAELLDDLFLLHDAVYPMLGVPEPAVVALYGVATLALMVVYRDELGGPGLVAIGFSGALFAASFGADQLWPGNHLFEDGLKFVGIATWASYALVLSAAELRSTCGHVGVNDAPGESAL